MAYLGNQPTDLPSGISTSATGTVLSLSDTANTNSVNVVLDNQKEVRFRETTANGTNFIGILAPASLASDFTLTLPAATDTLVGLTTTDTLTNKTISGSSNTISNIGNSSLTNSNFTLADDTSSTTTISLGETLKIAGGSGVDTLISGDTLTISLEGSIVTETSTDTLTNKSISLSTNTITGTLAEFNTAVSDADFASLAGSETLTNKTLTTPIISSISNTGTLTLPTSTDTLVGKATTDTLTNKSVSLNTNTITGTLAEFNTAVSDADFASLAGSETLTNKTISGSSNTISNVANSSLTNSIIKFADDTSTVSSIPLGGTLKIVGATLSGDTLTLAGGGGGTSWQAVQTSAFTAAAGEGYFVNTTSAAITATLPASPSIGDTISFIDYAGTFDSNNLTIARNGNPIQGSATNLTVSVERAGFALVFTDNTQGWLLENK